MINRFLILFLTFVLMAALLGACGGGSDDDSSPTPDSSKTPVPSATVDDDRIVKDAKAFFDNPPQFAVDLDGEKTIEDFAVPEVNMDIPDIGMGSLDFDLEYNPDVSVGGLNVPSASSLMGDLPGLPSGGSDAPPAGYVPSAADCARFAAAPSCSFVPEQYRDMCEQCKALGY